MKLIGHVFEPGSDDERERMARLLATAKQHRQSQDISWCMELGHSTWLKLREYYLNGILELGLMEDRFGT